MNQKPSKNPIKRKRALKKRIKLEKEGKIVAGLIIPDGAIAADRDKQGYPAGFSPRYYYRDVAYTCRGCGKEEVWTAQQQKRYYEDQKGNIYNEATWCHDCHIRRTKEKYGE